jgi:hypothetical protein
MLEHLVDDGVAQVGGDVRDLSDPYRDWIFTTVEGGCQLFEGTFRSCTPTCEVGEICTGPSSCRRLAVAASAGTVTLSGLPVPVMMEPSSATSRYYQALPEPLPPFGPAARLGLHATGAVYPAFTVEGRGLEPLAVSAGPIHVVPGQPLSVTWTAPSTPGVARVAMRLGFGGEIDVRVVCDFPDTGQAVVPAALIEQALARGVTGDAFVNVRRQTIGSTTLPHGCVDFWVASQVWRDLTVEGYTFCPDTVTCPEPLTCGVDLICR